MHGLPFIEAGQGGQGGVGEAPRHVHCLVVAVQDVQLPAGRLSFPLQPLQKVQDLDLIVPSIQLIPYLQGLPQSSLAVLDASINPCSHAPESTGFGSHCHPCSAGPLPAKVGPNLRQATERPVLPSSYTQRSAYALMDSAAPRPAPHFACSCAVQQHSGTFCTLLWC